LLLSRFVKILLVTQYYPPELGAAQERLAAYAEYMAEVGHEVTVLTAYPSYQMQRGAASECEAVEWRNGVQVRRVPTFRAFGPGFAPRLACFLSFMAAATVVGRAMAADPGQRPDVLLVETPPLFAALAGQAIGARCGAPVVYHVADLWVDALEAFGFLRPGSPPSRALRALERRLYRGAAGVVTVTDGCREKIIAAGAAPRDVTVVPNGVDTGRYRPDAPPPRMPDWEGRFVCLYAGTQGYIHAVDTVLGAAERLRGHPEILFALLGGGSEKETLAHKARQQGLENVRFLPPRRPAELAGCIARADVALATLRDCPLSESALPVKMLTYLACGTPVLLSGRGVSAEVLRESHGGLCLPPEDPEALATAILALQSDPTRRAHMGHRGREFVARHYCRRRFAAQIAGLLESIVAPRLPTGAPVEV
jgi:putative colanic acid biosynthesis glycosyltransferase WcaI